MLSKLYYVALVVVLVACQHADQGAAVVENTAAPGFDYENSDPAAVELADSIMSAMGGRRHWDNTRFISWQFGSRHLTWDKHTGRVRVETADSTIYLINLHTGEGKVQVKGEEVVDKELSEAKRKEGESYWINDAYWLVMPFKLKDTGVTLKYLGEETVDSARYNLLQVTFKDVGNTPQNKYLLYVDLTDNLVKKWAYYKDATQDTATFMLPWDNYKQYGDILLSADRTDGRGPQSVRVDKQMPDTVFENF